MSRRNEGEEKLSEERDNKKKKPPEEKIEWRRASKTLWIFLLIAIAVIILSQLNLREKEAIIPYDRFERLVDEGKVQSGTVFEQVFYGTLKPTETPGEESGKKFRTTLPPYMDNAMVQRWREKGVSYEFKVKRTDLGVHLLNMLPWIFLLGFGFFLLRRLQGGGAPRGIFSFGKSRAKLIVENKSRVTFANVAGADEAKEELQEIISFLRDPKKFQKLGGRIPRGALLLGPPGTGKTLMARAVAGEAEVPFFSMSGADFVEMFVGVGASRVRDLFEQGKKHAPCIIFIDEIDAVGRQRGAGLGGGHDEREQTLNQLLVEMDGFDPNEGVILLAATNRPDILDPALTRPGRFDRQIVVDRPDVRGREGILRVHTKNIPLADDVDLAVLAKGTPGLAGAELANLVNEAALIGARRDADFVTMTDMDQAKDKVMMGPERKSLLISPEEKRSTAYHEAGHVLVAKLIPNSDPVHKVTIIPRGRALGLTHFLPLDEKHNYPRSYLESVLARLLGGRAAELIVFGETTTGAGDDLEKATQIARKMICEWGMSEKLGPLTYGQKEEEIFIGREISQVRDYSEQTAELIDSEVRRIVTEADETAERLIREHRNGLDRLASALLERESLDGEEIDKILQLPRTDSPEQAQGETEAAQVAL
ncbi:MAG: ATP-dependent zinc metalloprotease FtsH [bacterium]